MARCHEALLATIEAVASCPEARLTDLPRQSSTRPPLALQAGAPLATPPEPLLGRLIAVATSTPGSPAIEQEGQATLSYEQLLTAVQRLSAAGVQGGARVALLLPRRPETVVAQLGDSSYAGQSPLAPLVALQVGSGLPLFCLPPADGLAWCYLGLGRFLPGVSILALQAPGLTAAAPASFEALIDGYLKLVLSAEPRGPYRLLGWSSGGGVAHALACRLQARCAQVSLLAMLDAYPAEMWHGKPEPTAQDAWLAMLDEADATALQHAPAPLTESQLLARLKRPGGSLAGFDDAALLRMNEVAVDSMRSYRTACHAHLAGDVLFFRAARYVAGAPQPSLWQPHVSGVLDVIDVEATHLQMCSATSLASIATVLAPRLADR